MNVTVPGGSWQLAGRPTAINAGKTAADVFFDLIPWLFGLLCGCMTYMIVRANLKVRALALHDALTEIPNLRYLKQMAENQIAQSQRSGRPFSVLHLDIDDFKLVNDRYGHKAGDKGLIFAARQAQKTLRSADFIARVGGDEFIVLLPDTGSDDLLHTLIDRLRASMCSPFDYDGMSLSLQISVGWATFPDEGQDLDQLIKNADKKMYALKRTGKEPGEQSEGTDQHISIHLSE
jgi:diguanylate cyclase (GGDEF)-like protein